MTQRKKAQQQTAIRDAVVDAFSKVKAERRYTVVIPDTSRHVKQHAFVRSRCKRKIARCGRRGGKTTGAAVIAVEAFLAGRRVLYATPTGDQFTRFWGEVCAMLAEPIKDGVYHVNQVEHTISLPGIENINKQRIRAKTAWNAETLRGDYADLLIMDEYQLMNEDAWKTVGAPMLIDNNGDAIFIYTPPSLHSKAFSKATDKRHASKMFKAAKAHMEKAAALKISPEWEAFHWTSFDNPFVSQEGLENVSKDMTALAKRQELLAEDIDELPGALWKRDILEANRVSELPDVLTRLGIGVDPPGTTAECGIVAAGVTTCYCKGYPEEHGFIVADKSLQGSPDEWSAAVCNAYRILKASFILAETNYGGDMVKHTILTKDKTVNVQVVTATRGKALRAEPVAALYEQGKVHHVGEFPLLEDEFCIWTPSDTKSPNRLDAAVHILRNLMVKDDYASLAEDGMMTVEHIPEEFQRMSWPSEF